MKYRQIQAAEIDFSGFMQYNGPEPEQSRCRCGMFTLRSVPENTERGMPMLKGKTVLLGVSGSIAAYKTAYLASALKKLDADVHVLMTQNATNFINPITFETLTGNKCLVDTFDRNFEFSVEHVSLAKQADVVMISDFEMPPASEELLKEIQRAKRQGTSFYALVFGTRPEMDYLACCDKYWDM